MQDPIIRMRIANVRTNANIFVIRVHPYDLVKDKGELWYDYRRSIDEIHELGVQHGHLHSDNVLWNSQLGRVQIIDFHRSTLLGPQVGRLKKRLANVYRGGLCQCAALASDYPTPDRRPVVVTVKLESIQLVSNDALLKLFV
ncbi:hypothetical protein V1506DRAFT_381557 [Lipomyces tetrasporus]